MTVPAPAGAKPRQSGGEGVEDAQRCRDVVRGQVGGDLAEVAELDGVQPLERGAPRVGQRDQPRAPVCRVGCGVDQAQLQRLVAEALVRARAVCRQLYLVVLCI
jgi:hypothetical protein